MNIVRKLLQIALLVAPTMVLVMPSTAAAQPYKANDKIEYRATTFPADLWEVGTFVRNAPNGKQAIIRLKPTEFNPEGFQKAVDLEDIRPYTAPAPVAANPNQPGVNLPPPLEIPETMPPPLDMPVMLPPPLDMPQLPPPLGMPPAALPAGPPAAMKAGDKIEYKASPSQDTWLVGTFVRKASNSYQVIIREAPSEFYPEGFQRAYDSVDVRPLAKPQQDEMNIESCGGDGEGFDQTPGVDRVPAPMTQEDVLAFLRARMPTGDPFRNPKREKFLEELRWEILSRGTAFRYQILGTFANELGKYGALTNVTAALSGNVGPPAKLQDLFGTWLLIKTGLANPREGNGRSWTPAEYVGNGFAIVINPDRTYTWYATKPPIRGQWRAATSEEMAKSDKGGEGIVVLNGKSNVPWLIFKRTEEGPQGEGIKIVDLATRNLRERGTR